MMNKSRRNGRFVSVLSPEQRFLSHVTISPTGCFLWDGYLDKNGYGSFHPGGPRTTIIKAHRWSYEHFKGPIKEGLVIDHLCKVRNCVNPEHLEAVSIKENTLRGDGLAALNSRKSTCPSGHQYSEENTGHDKSGRRYCKECRRTWRRLYYSRKVNQKKDEVFDDATWAAIQARIETLEELEAAKELFSPEAA